MKKLLYSLLFVTVLVSCKKDEENKDQVNCSNDFSFLQKSATATFNYTSLLTVFDKLTIVYTPSGSSTKAEFTLSGDDKNTKSTLYYSACGSKLYQSLQSDMKDAQLLVDFNTPINEIFTTKSYSFGGQLSESQYRIADKSYKFTLEGKEYTGYKVENMVGELEAMGYEIISKEFGIVETSSMTENKVLVLYE